MLKLTLGTAVLSCCAFGACFPVAGDRIYGSDLAAAIPAFSSISPGVTIAYAPAPGTQRIFAVAELARIARANRVNLLNPAPNLSEVCFEIPMRPMTAEETLASMRRSLPPEAELSIVELPKTNIPAGILEFPLTGLEPAFRSTRVWRGSVRYAETLRMPIWARVTVQRKSAAVVADRDLAANAAIDPKWVRLETVAVPLDAERLALRIEDVYGRVPTKPVRAGQTIPLSILDFPPSVHRGDAVTVEVQSGLARLRFDAVAEGAARTGDMVSLRNPSNGRVFRARVEQAGRAVLVVPSRQAL